MVKVRRFLRHLTCRFRPSTEYAYIRSYVEGQRKTRVVEVCHTCGHTTTRDYSWDA